MVKAALHVCPCAKSRLLARSRGEDATGTMWRTASSLLPGDQRSTWRRAGRGRAGTCVHALSKCVAQAERLRGCLQGGTGAVVTGDVLRWAPVVTAPTSRRLARRADATARSGSLVCAGDPLTGSLLRETL